VIGALLDATIGRAQRADAVIKTDQTLSLTLTPEGQSRVWSSDSSTTYLRVMVDGRVGHASASGADPAGLRDRALAAAPAGPALDLHLPLPAPLPELSLRSPAVAVAEVPALDGLARILFERLQRTQRRVEVWVERSIGSVRLGNTRGVLTGYEATLAGAGAVVESIGAGYAPPCRVHQSGAGLPELVDLEGLVNEVDRRLDPPLIQERRRDAALPVCFSPRAVAALLVPLRAALTGREAWFGDSPLRGRLGERVFDPKLTVTDDPLATGRPGSRPVDDDGVVARPIAVIERGRIVGFLADLETGSRAGIPSTGHAWRIAGSGSRVGFTNLRVSPGIETRATLLTMMGRGLLVEDLEWRAGPNPIRGTFRLPAPWTYLVENGSVKGRLEGITLAGNIHDVLTRIGAIGSDLTWIGAVGAPSILVDGVGVG
jgi:PmbA protein